MGRRPIGKVAMTAAERQRKHRQQFRDSRPVTKSSPAADAALKAENDRLKARIAELEDAALKAALLGERRTPKPRAAKPKAEKPPLPPNEVRDREIKALKSRVRNLAAELRYTREFMQGGKSAMSFATMSAIAKALHPDTRKQATEADLDKACKLFTAWKADKDKAR